MTTEPIAAFKGFNKDLTCRGVQYKVGETYEHPGPVKICDSGFHAVTLPLDALTYYKPGESVYHAVDLEGVVKQPSGDSKVVGRKITVGAQLNILGLVKAHVEAVFKSVKEPSAKSKATTGRYANAATTGYYANAATTGRYANAATTGDYANAATTGRYANAATTGRYANAATTGYSANVRASVKDETAIAAVLGQGAACGARGSWLVLTERDDNWNILGVQAVQVDGEKVKARVFYTLRGGEVVAA